ncbi:MAG: DnaD domain protein, partial [Tissierellaceae bacterium]
NKLPEVNTMFNNIDNIMRRQTVPMEKQKIIDWINDYNMNPDVIEKAFFYGVERRGVRNLNYIEGIIRNWYDEGLTNMDALMEYFKKKDEKYFRYQSIMKSLGLDKRPIRDEEKEIIDSWFADFKFNLDLVLKACEADKNPVPSIKYVNGILKAWYKKGIKTINDIELLDKPIEKHDNQKKTRTQVKKPKAVTTRFHNFEQRSDKYSAEDLERIAQRKRQAYGQRAKGEQ